jgi:UDP-glucuronate 4-epimerase
MWRDFTFVEDIVQGVVIVLEKIVADTTEYNEIYNIGYGKKNNLMDFIRCVEKHAGKEAIIELCPPHPADVPATWCDASKLMALGYKPQVSMDDGVKECVDWFRDYYHC